MGIVRPPTLKFRISRASESKDGTSGARRKVERTPEDGKEVSSRKREEDAEGMSQRPAGSFRKGINNSVH